MLLLNFSFPNKEKITLPFCSTLALLQSLSLRPLAYKMAETVEQTGGYNFYIKGKRKKYFQLVKPDAQLSIFAWSRNSSLVS